MAIEVLIQEVIEDKQTLMPAIEAAEKAGTLPAHIKREVTAFDEWAPQVTGKETPVHHRHADVAEHLANALQEHQALFGEEAKPLIEKFTRDAARLAVEESALNA